MEWLIFTTIFMFAFACISMFKNRRRRIQDRLNDQIIQIPQKQKTKKQARLKWHRLLGQFASGFTKNLRHGKYEKIQFRLVRAGSPHGISPSEWIGIRLLVVICSLFLGILFVYVQGIQASSLAMLLALSLLGLILPEFWLSRRITMRQNSLKKQLPSTLDLLTVSVEAGLGFDQALSQVSDEMTGPIAEEIQRVLREIRLGSPRLDALQRLAQRTGVDVIELFVSSVVQADKLGIGLTRVLRIQAEEVRRKQRSDAQEKAMKAPIKILFPLVLFVFPALFIVILGPAVIQMMNSFSKFM